MIVFVDYDGTITDLDTFDVLVRRLAGEHAWLAFERALDAGSMTLREALAGQAALVRETTLAQADALLAAATRVDPAFVRFVATARERDVPVRVVSSGIAPLIRAALGRCGLGDLEVFANEVDDAADGWRLRFRDDSANGHDKAAAVRAAAATGRRTVYVGDGRSDYEAARVADVRFARRGLALEAHLRAAGVAYAPFDDFADVAAALFAPTAAAR